MTIIRTFNFIAICALISSSFASPNTSPRNLMVNGQPVSGADYPWMVALRMHFVSWDWDRMICGGSLIQTDPIVVLTAAHCLSDSGFTEDAQGTIISQGDPIELYLDFGRTNGVPAGDDTFHSVQLTSLNTSKLYNVSNSNSETEAGDIALIVINDTQTLPANYPIASIAQQSPCCAVGETLTALGFGYYYSQTGLNQMADTLEKISMEYNDEATCKQNFEKTGATLKDDLICATGIDADICDGDFGGPLFRLNASGHPEIVGVASSFNHSCSEETKGQFPGYFTNVAMYKDWRNWTSTDSDPYHDHEYDPDDDPRNSADMNMVNLITCFALTFVVMFM